MSDMRTAFAQTATALIEEDPRAAVVLAEISADLFGDAAARHPDRVLNVGIREQLMVSVSGGLALAGMRPIVHTYAPFLVERAFEQVKLDLAHQGTHAVLASIGASWDAAKLWADASGAGGRSPHRHRAGLRCAGAWASGRGAVAAARGVPAAGSGLRVRLRRWVWVWVWLRRWRWRWFRRYLDVSAAVDRGQPGGDAAAAWAAGGAAGAPGGSDRSGTYAVAGAFRGR